ncbi:hypothetical protein KAFR_0G03760 [Kazachstania africana CBS 2517]|uniref:Vacuolar protein sorting-associated protein 62 n=1 Tax=Kazachstania africana (strain ATCC 22294 / BCRC 22015 / CBS 2517 / CECT 1963 / NBRC 1671 / NRRL Y-8276) TaxID=1071382 RepID=H2AYF9_KAZAF|nr:hypothetical protein KAFR_0G03760 [Kazachstania africana CBS 2517]CCF59409.1 hypothetical protein KAFR_0G03760 [Kazachstania africana CBS 2517]
MRLIVLIYLTTGGTSMIVPWFNENTEFFKMKIRSIEDPNNEDSLPFILNAKQVNDSNKSLVNDSYIPQYVLENAPIVHLSDDELYFPQDIETYIENFKVTDESNNTILEDLTLQQLENTFTFRNDDLSLSNVHSSKTFLTSKTDFTQNPDYMFGSLYEYKNTGEIRKSAPSVLIVVDKGNGWVDAFWFFFYAFNNGPTVLGNGPWGSHLGDWEHCVVRFFNGQPKAIYMSQHSTGSAYDFNALEKFNGRPLVFSAKGTHGNYASPGRFSHDIPYIAFKPLNDVTDRGPLWDPTSKVYSYKFNPYKDNEVIPINADAKKIGRSWLYYQGHWGNRQLDKKDSRQKTSIFESKYVTGPRGPLYKNLDRVSICGDKNTKICHLKSHLRRSEGFHLAENQNGLVGNNCGVLLEKIKPRWLREIAYFITWRGSLCYLMDLYTG